MTNSILVTGASGFIGSWVCKKLIGRNVVAAVSPFSNPTRLTGLDKDLTVVKVDLANSKEVEILFKKYKPKFIIHLATHGVYQYQQKDIERIIVDNYLMTANLLSFSVKYGVTKFINTGSVFEYGSQNKKVKEEDVSLGDIINEYSAIKIATTALTNSYSVKLDVITLRPFTTYGPFEDETRFVAATINRALKNEEIKLVKGVVRDFVYVEDVANAFVKALKVDFKSGEIVNIACGQKQTLESTASLIRKITNSKSKIIVDPKYKRSKESACWADITKAKIILKWQPEYDFETGLRKSVDFLKK